MNFEDGLSYLVQIPHCHPYTRYGLKLRRPLLSAVSMPRRNSKKIKIKIEILGVEGDEGKGQRGIMILSAFV